MPHAVRRRQRFHALKIVRERAGGKTRFKLAGYYVDGRRVRKYFDSEGAAKTFLEAEQIRRLNLGARATRIDGALAEDALRAADSLRNTPYGLLDAAKAVARAHEQLVPFALTIDAAVSAHVQQLEQRRRSVPVRVLVREYIDNRRAKNKSTIYIRDLETRLGRFAAAMGDRIVSELTTAEIDRWIQSLSVGPQTQNNFRAVLSSAWTFAVRCGYASSHVVQLVDKTQVVRDHVPFFSAAQIEVLLKSAPAELAPVLAIGAFAGLRPEEINKLHWEHVDFDERTIAVNASAAKTRKKRFAEISDNLATWLSAYPNRFGPIAPRNLQKLRRATMAAAGIANWPQDVLRHSFASAHYAFHRNPARTAMLLGHRDQDMLLTHYRGLMKPSEAERYWKIVPAIIAAKNKIIAISRPV